jgi:hypothetical protein
MPQSCTREGGRPASSLVPRSGQRSGTAETTARRCQGHRRPTTPVRRGSWLATAVRASATCLRRPAGTRRATGRRAGTGCAAARRCRRPPARWVAGALGHEVGELLPGSARPRIPELERRRPINRSRSCRRAVACAPGPWRGPGSGHFGPKSATTGHAATRLVGASPARAGPSRARFLIAWLAGLLELSGST